MRWMTAGCLLAALVLVGRAQTAAPPVQVDADEVFHDMETLASDGMEGRLAGSSGGARARAYVLERLKDAGVPPAPGGFEHPFTFTTGAGERQGTNLLGIIRGTASPGRFIVVTAHYDHIGVRNGIVFNGADDNASGTAGLLALAAHFVKHPPRHSLLIAALDAEEEGEQGARALMRDPPVPIAAMAVNVNMDMIGRDPEDVLYAVGTSYYPFLKPYLTGVAQAPVRLAFGHDVAGGKRNTKDEDWTDDSDHTVFHDAHIPFVYFGVEDFGQHHESTDDAATMGKAFMAGAAATVIAAVSAFDEHLDEIVAATGGR